MTRGYSSGIWIGSFLEKKGVLPETFCSLILEKGVYYNRKWTTDMLKSEPNN